MYGSSQMRSGPLGIWGRSVNGSESSLADLCLRLAMKIDIRKAPDFMKWAHGKLW